MENFDRVNIDELLEIRQIRQYFPHQNFAPYGTYDAEKLQQDIDFVLSWANIWQMKFNILKYCYIYAHITGH